ncbi:hypothetical protein LINPERPRIM_LOCUS6271 [Linum perenne]
MKSSTNPPFSSYFSPLPFLLVLFFVIPSVGWPLGSNGCGTMAVTGFPLSELQARWSPEYVFMAITSHLCRRDSFSLLLDFDSTTGGRMSDLCSISHRTI